MKSVNLSLDIAVETDLHASELTAAGQLAMEAAIRSLLAPTRHTGDRYIRMAAAVSPATITTGSK